nr:hypothetical protein [uncultured Rhodopila sp.]
MIAASPTAAADPLPITALGMLQFEGVDHYGFRLADGTTLALTFEQLQTRPLLVGLFGGNEAWLRQTCPGAFVVVASREGGGRRVPTGIDLAAAAERLAQACVDVQREKAAERAAAVPATLPLGDPS